MFTSPPRTSPDPYPTSKQIVNHPAESRRPVINLVETQEEEVRAITMVEDKMDRAQARTREAHQDSVKAKASRAEMADSKTTTDEAVASQVSDKAVMKAREAVVGNPHRLNSLPSHDFMSGCTEVL